MGSKPKGDIVALAYLLIVACLVQVAVGIVLIFFAALLPNDYRIVFHTAQWSFALLAVLFPWIGILGAWKTLLSALLGQLLPYARVSNLNGNESGSRWGNYLINLPH